MHSHSNSDDHLLYRDEDERHCVVASDPTERYRKVLVAAGKFTEEELNKIDGLRIIGTSEKKASVITFVIDGIHPYDIGTIIDTDGIAIRTGHHCTMPAIKHFNLPATARASFAFYNTKEEIDYFVESLEKAREMFI